MYPFHNKANFQWGVVSSSPNLEVHPFLAVCDCLFIIFAATLYIWKLFPPAATWGHATQW